MGKQVVKKSAAYTRSPDDRGPVSIASLQGVLLFCIRNADGALARLPVEIVRTIEQILHETVRPFRVNVIVPALAQLVIFADGVLWR